jgi:fumarate hydratase class I
VLRLHEGLVELIKKVVSSVPPDVDAALRQACERLEPGSEAHRTLSRITEEIRASRGKSAPVCQDTGIPTFHVKAPTGLSHKDLENAIREALSAATAKIPLKPVAVDPVTGDNSGDNTGQGFPLVYIEESPGTTLSVELILTGSASENIGRTYILPDETLGAGQDTDGAAMCVVDAVRQAGGKACPPYIVGVGLGASREQATRLSKLQLLRKLPDENPDPTLAALESRLLEDINGLGIGPLGLGGPVTALGVKIGANHRHAHTYVVDVSLACWADRRGKLIW